MKTLFNTIIAFFISILTPKRVDLTKIRTAINEFLVDCDPKSENFEEETWVAVKSALSLCQYPTDWDWRMDVISKDDLIAHVGLFVHETRKGEPTLLDFMVLSPLSEREKAENVLLNEGFNKITRSRSPIVFSGKGLDYYKNGTLFAVLDDSGMFVEWDDSKEHSFVLQSYKYDDIRKAKSNKSKSKGI